MLRESKNFPYTFLLKSLTFIFQFFFFFFNSTYSKIGAIHNNPDFAQIAHNHNTLLNGKGKEQDKFLKLSCIVIKHGEHL